MSRKEHKPRLQWVIVDGDLYHVSAFAGKQRPTAYCPLCDQEITMKLGPERIYHVAHKPGDVCLLTQPETIIHFNCKQHIYSQLQRWLPLKTVRKCCGAMSPRGGHVDCSRTTEPIVFLQEWDDVQLEYEYGPYRLDVALLQHGKVFGALEIWVKHKTDEAKLAYLDAHHVSWLEIQGSEEFYSNETAWSIEQPIPYVRPQVRWQCKQCREQAKATANWNAFIDKKYGAKNPYKKRNS